MSRVIYPDPLSLRPLCIRQTHMQRRKRAQGIHALERLGVVARDHQSGLVRSAVHAGVSWSQPEMRREVCLPRSAGCSLYPPPARTTPSPSSSATHSPIRHPAVAPHPPLSSLLSRAFARSLCPPPSRPCSALAGSATHIRCVIYLISSPRTPPSLTCLRRTGNMSLSACERASEH
jgi:hypothetical protein